MPHVSSYAQTGEQNVDLNVTFTITSDWGTGYNAEIKVENQSPAPVNDWTLEFDLLATIDVLWNGNLTTNGNHHVVTDAGWNQTIATQASVSIGFGGSYTDTLFAPTNGVLNGEPFSFTTDIPPPPSQDSPPGDEPPPDEEEPPAEDNPDIQITFSKTSDWGTGYNAEITIKNQSPTPINGWTLEFDLEPTITTLWNGNHSSVGNHHTVTDAGWNETIQPNQTVSIGFGGTYSGTFSGPTNAIFNDQPVTFTNPTDGENDPPANDTEPPAKPTISVLKNWTDGGYDVQWNKWYGTDASGWDLIEDGTVIHTETLSSADGGHQSDTYHIDADRYGAFIYQVRLKNNAGETLSDIAHYITEGASPIVLDTVDVDRQALQITINLGSANDYSVDNITQPLSDFTLSTNNSTVIDYRMIDDTTLQIQGLTPGRASLKIEDGTNGDVRYLGVRVTDAAGNAPGLPEYLGLGSVSEDTSADLDFWKAFSDDLTNRRMDIRYIYINGGPKNQGGGWRTWTTVDGFRVTSYIRESLKLGMIPFLVYYNIPDGSESYFTDKQHIESQNYMEGYFTDLKFALELAVAEAGNEVVGWLMEPDFFGYFAQNDNRHPSQVLARTDAAYNVGVLNPSEDPVFPNTMTGLVQAINYTIGKYMPNAYFGWQFNLWASPAGGWTTPIPGNGIIHLTDTMGIQAGRTAIFQEASALTDYYIDAGVLSHNADFVSIDKYGLDAGAEGKSDNPATAIWFWNAVHWTNYLTFVEAMNTQTQLPVILWQIPVGRINQSLAYNPYSPSGEFPELTNTPMHYEDSAATYFFGDHFATDGPRLSYFSATDSGVSNVSVNGNVITWGSHIDLAKQAGVKAILFGAGVGISTDGVGSPPTDDYWWITKSQSYYTAPVPTAPQALSARQQGPSDTQLFFNYPNPFNPETWIPYRLATDSAVTLTIYDMRGTIVRAITVDHQRAGVYTSKDKAIYWDGRNDLGEQVASGVYLYRLTAKDFSATRKMVTIK